MSEDAIREAVRAAFPQGTSELTPLTGGRSQAVLFAFEAEGARWVARHSPYEGTERLRVAAEAGVGPALRHVDTKNEVAIMARFDGLPAPAARDPSSRAKIAAAVRRLHDGPAFPPSISTAEIYARLRREHVTRVGEDVPRALDELLDRCAERTARFPLAPCHRDLHPMNVLVQKEPEFRVCILDWDSAGASDPYLDVAQFCVFYAPTEEQRADFWRDYLEREPNAEEKAHADTAHVYALAGFALAFALVGGKPVRAKPLPMPELYAHLREHGASCDGELVSASFLAEAQRLAT